MDIDKSDISILLFHIEIIKFLFHEFNVLTPLIITYRLFKQRTRAYKLFDYVIVNYL